MTAHSTRKQLLSAISSMDRRVTIPDMVARTGLSLSEVSTALNELAYELKADLDVTDSGQIYYRFPVDLHYRYFSNRLANVLYRIWIGMQPALKFLFRISFGLLLLVSITIVFLIMLVLQALASTFSGNPHEVLALIKEFLSLLKKLRIIKKINWKFWQKPGIERKDENEEPQADKGFLLNCHQYLFGPENPNKNFENDKSKAIAQLIRVNNGIILPEQLAPLSGSAAEELEGAFPVLAKFHGIPSATPSGHLLYKFPEMQEAAKVSANVVAITNDDNADAAMLSPSTLNSKEREAGPPANVKMKPRVFAEIKMDAIKPILLVAIANFLGTVLFCFMLYSVQSSDGFTASIFLLLAIYASFVLLFPAFRWISVQILNRQIKRYNEKIDKLEASLNHPDDALKLAAAEVSKLRQDEVAKLSSNLAYTTTRDFLEQETDHLFSQPDIIQ